MIRSYLKTAVRSLLKHKGYALINVLGLAVGIAASVLIMLYVFDELGYDRFHANAGRIYRITADWSNKGDSAIHQLGTPDILARTLRQDFPQAEAVTQIGGPVEDTPVRFGQKVFKGSDAFLADPDFFRVFSFPVLQGDPATCLRDPGSIVLCRSVADKLFGAEDPLGKTVELILGPVPRPVKVTAVAADVPANSHVRFGLLVSTATYRPQVSTGWSENNSTTYILAREGVTQERMKAVLAEIDRTRFEGGRKHIPWVWTPVPLTRIHLDSDLATGADPNGSRAYVRLFAAAALLILLIAGINFVNLATARSVKRAREVAIRKTVGSERRQLIGQFLGESVVTAFAALLLAVGLIQAALPFYRDLTGRALGLRYFSNPWVVPGLLGLALAVGLLAGLYPAFVLSSVRQGEVLKGGRTTGSGRGALALRNGLVVFQFAMSVLLIMGSIVISRQLDFVRNRRLGFDKENVVVVHDTGTLGARLDAYRERLGQVPEILGTAAVGSIPGSGTPNWGIRVDGVPADRPLNMDFMVCDHDFASTLGIRMLRGRFLSREFPADAEAVVINKTAADYIGLPDPIGRKITSWTFRKGVTIVGVMDDIQFESLHSAVIPMGYYLNRNADSSARRYLLAKLDSGRTYQGVEALRRAWEALPAGLPFEVTFLDDRIGALYQNDARAGKVVTLFSVLSFFISALGLFGLAAFVTAQRTKEIGVRKVLGSGVGRIVWLVGGSFVKWVVAATLIAWPLGYWLMGRWLKGFAARTELAFWIFALSGAAALAVAAVSVGGQVLRAAVANPSDSIRYE